MPGRHVCVGVVLSYAVFLATAVADVIWKSDGSKVVGKVIEEERDRVLIRVQRGKMEATVWIDREHIDRIETGALPEEEFERRLAELDPADYVGHKQLIEWAKGHKLRDGVRRLEQGLDDVEWRHRKRTHPRTWCRGCDARGQSSCLRCHGKGTLIDPCKRCDAAGHIDCRICADAKTPGFLRCRKCSGGGKIERFDVEKARKETIRCPQCRGTGEQDCPDCDGTLREACPRCEGEKGSSRKCDSCGGRPQQACLSCRGSGIQATPVSDAQFEKEQADERADDGQDPKTKSVGKPPRRGGDPPGPGT